MKIVHFSDPHAGGWPQSGSAFFDKRIIGAFNYNLRRKAHFKIDRLKTAVEKSLLLNPQVVAITGDITSVSEPWEFELACQILKPLVDSDIKLIYIPGNHDAYVKNRKCKEALEKAFHYLNQGRYELSDLPRSEKCKNVNLVLLNEAIPTSPVFSCGQLCEDSAKQLNAPLEEGEIRIAVGHFPALDSNKDEISFRRKLYGNEALKKALNDGKVHASLCGHIHKPFINQYGKNSFEICAGSITANGHINVLEINQVDGTLHQHWEIIDQNNTVKSTKIFANFPNLNYSTDNLLCQVK